MGEKSIEYNVEFYVDDKGKHTTTWQLLCDLINKRISNPRRFIRLYILN